MFRLIHITVIFLTLAATASAATAAEKVSYNFEIKPILSDRCFLCHGFDEAHRAADLRLDTPEAAYAERDGSTPIVPGDPEASEIWRRIISDDPKVVMPTPESHLTLTDDEKELIRRWIEQGAEYEEHWAFIPPTRPAAPQVENDAWVANPIDAFILSTLEARGLSPSPKADPTTLARRIALDLTGLPPSPDVNLTPDEQIRHLLDSPHFGEKWTLPWLDAARYADSNGFQGDPNNYNWPWRDYMIRAFNANRPFDQVITELLAGDLLPNSSQEQKVATAFQRMHPINDEGGSIREELLFNYRADRVDAVATSMLGLTFACAQCHDHKYDPVSHEEYFQFMAFFSNIEEEGAPRHQIRAPHHLYKLARPTMKLEMPELEAELAAANDRYDSFLARNEDVAKAFDSAFYGWARELDIEAELQQPHFTNFLAGQARLVQDGGKLNENQYDQLTGYFLKHVSDRDDFTSFIEAQKREKEKLQAVDSQIPRVMVMQERTDRAATYRLHDRGLYDAPVGDELPAAIPAAIGALPEGEANRLTLANWMVSQDNPLTARVLVNRIWQEIFGVGIVKTPEDFGFQGALPSHPELLDWLAVEFQESGWDFKHMVRLIVSSNTYQQGSQLTPKLAEVDPENTWLSRGPRFRLPAMLIRDYALASSGLLEPQLYGPPTYPYQPKGLWREVSFNRFGYPKLPEAAQQHRRSIYSFWRRTMGPPNMFDTANRQMCVVTISRTNTPLQALTLLNDPLFLKAALTLANTYLEADDSISNIFTRVTLRPPTDRERSVLEAALERETAHFAEDMESAKTLTGVLNDSAPRLAALTVIAQTILNLDEAITKE